MLRLCYLFALPLVGSLSGQTQTTYNVSSVAGTGASGYTGDNGSAINATLNTPRGVATDTFGNLYIADVGNNVVRRIAKDGNISTFAGTGIAGYSGDGGLATKANLNQPYRVAADKSGNVFIADTGNSRVRKVDSQGTITTVAGNGNSTPFGGVGGLATQATIGPVAGLFSGQQRKYLYRCEFHGAEGRSVRPHDECRRQRLLWLFRRRRTGYQRHT